MTLQDYKELADFLRTGQFDETNPKSIFYRGFGQLKALLYNPSNKQEWPEHYLKFQPLVSNIYDCIFDRYGSNSKQVIDGLKSATTSSYFTPKLITDAIINALDLSKMNSAIDPSAGTGNFIQSLPEHLQITGVEPDPLSHQILKQRFSGISTYQDKLQEVKLQKHDLVISNIPFGNVKVYDPDFYASKNATKIKSCTRIHNYFFLKSLDILNSEGYLVFITSSAFSDSSNNEEFRKYMVTKADLIAAVRLPEETFTTTGTKPTCDLLIFKKNFTKKSPKPYEQEFIRTKQIEIDDTLVDCNPIFYNNENLVLGTPHPKGQYGQPQYAVTSSEELSSIAKKLTNTISDQIRIYKEQANTKQKGQSTLIDSKKRISLESFQQNYVTGSLFVDKNKVYKINADEHGYFLDPVKEIKDVNRTLAIINLRILYNALLYCESENHPDVEKLRAGFNYQYDMFTFQYGNFHDPINKKIIDRDHDGYMLMSLESKIGQLIKKADIFEKRITNATKIVEAPKDLHEAILLSLNAKNCINHSYICKLLNWTDGELVSNGIKDDLLYLDKTSHGWSLVTKDHFLSGNIYNKLSAFKTNFPERFEHYKEQHISMLEKVRPVPIPFELIDINLGERWIPQSIYDQFATEVFEEPTTVRYLHGTDSYSIKIQGYSRISSIEMKVNAKASSVDGRKLMEHAFCDTSPTMTYTISVDGQDVKKLDTEATRMAQERIQQLLERFSTWLPTKPILCKQLEDKYNLLFNNTAIRVYDGSHLKFSDLCTFTPYPHQNNAVYRILQQFGGITDHKVGAGKSLVMALSAYEMKRLGIANKPLIIAKKANVSSIYQEYITAFPNAKVLHPKASHFKPASRHKLFMEMMNNDWDCVIISHDQFKMIPQSRDIQREIIQDELDALAEDLRLLNAEEGATATPRQLKGLEKRKDNLHARLLELEDQIKRDPRILDFKKLGFDHIFVDESQEFKNLTYTTRHSQVSGLGSPKGSQRAFNLLIAARTLQKLHNGDKGITFLSGTTISNSLVELYLLFKYLRPNAMKELAIPSFDAWAKVYARKSYDFEFSVTNEIKRKERFREFIKVPELAKFYTEITDVVNDSNFAVDKPTVINQVISVTPTENQEAFMLDLIEFAKTKQGHHIGIGNLTEDQKQAYMLIATNYAKKMSLDMRLIDEEYGFEKGCKLDVCTQKVHEIYTNSMSFKGTQLIFCDMSIPSKEKWNVYDELVRILSFKYKIPREQIALIHDYDTEKKRKDLYQLLNDGIIRILIGSTTKMGVGVNVQKRIVAMHHLDIPWRPSDFEQRTGRGGRPGNIMAKQFNENQVHNFIYAVERSLDSYQFNVLSNKQLFINQVKENSLDQRKVDEGAISGDGDQMNFAEYVAMLSGNQTLLEKVKLDKKLKDLEMQYNSFHSQKSNKKFDLQNAKNDINHYNSVISNIKKDQQYKFDFESTPDSINKTEKRFYYPKPVIINKKKYYDTKVLGSKLIELVDQASAQNQSPDIGTYGNFRIYFSAYTESLIIESPEGIKYTQNNGIISTNPVAAGLYIKNALDKIEGLIPKYETMLEQRKADIPSYEKALNTEFDKLEELKALKEESKRLQQQLEDENTPENEVEDSASEAA